MTLHYGKQRSIQSCQSSSHIPPRSYSDSCCYCSGNFRNRQKLANRINQSIYGQDEKVLIQFDHEIGKQLKKETCRTTFVRVFLNPARLWKPISTKNRKAGVACPLIGIVEITISYKYALKIKDASDSLTEHARAQK